MRRLGPKGSPHAHFQRAIERRHLLSAETAARHLPKPLSLADALALLLLSLAFPFQLRFEAGAQFLDVLAYLPVGPVSWFSFLAREDPFASGDQRLQPLN